MVKKIIMVLTLTFTTYSFGVVSFSSMDEAQLAMEAQKRASEETKTILLEEIRRLKSSKTEIKNDLSHFNQLFDMDPTSWDRCDDRGRDRYQCVKHCKSRWSDGECRGYEPDFCGPDAKCVAKCTSRWSDGTCRGYESDFCGPNAKCITNCTSRWSDGECRGYGPDTCY